MEGCMIVICFISGWRGKIRPVILVVLCSDNDASHHLSPLLSRCCHHSHSANQGLLS